MRRSVWLLAAAVASLVPAVFAASTTVKTTPRVVPGAVVPNANQFLPTITGVKVVPNDNAQGGPVWIVEVEGSGNVPCSFGIDIIRSTDSYNYGQPLIANQTPQGWWQGLGFQVPKVVGVNYAVKVYGAGKSKCGGSAQTTIKGPDNIPALNRMTTPSPTYKVGDAIPIDVFFTKAACQYDIAIGQPGGKTQSLVGLYTPGEMSHHFPDIRQIIPELSYGAGNWFVTAKPTVPPNLGATAQKCAALPSMVYVNLVIK